MNWVWQQTLPPSEKIVLLAYADNADDGGVCWPGIPLVARKCGISIRTAQRVKRKLVERALIRIEPRYRPSGTRTSDRICLAMPPGDKLSPYADSGDRGDGDSALSGGR